MLNFILIIVIIASAMYIIDKRAQAFDTIKDPDNTISIEHFQHISPMAKSKIIDSTNKIFGDRFGKFSFSFGRMPLVVRELSSGKIIGSLALHMYGEFPIVSHFYMLTPGYARRVNETIEKYLEHRKCRRVGGWCKEDMVDFYKKFGAVVTDTTVTGDNEKRYLMAKWL